MFNFFTPSLDCLIMNGEVTHDLKIDALKCHEFQQDCDKSGKMEMKQGC